jgi:hypothetical protein
MISSHRSARFSRRLVRSVVWALVLAINIGSSVAQNLQPERTFSQSKAVVEEALKGLQTPIAGRLPILDGFATPGQRSLDKFQRAYYQCSVVVSSTPSGGSRVRVSAKITALYADPVPSRSGYQTLPSNGRLESDLLDQLGDALGGGKASIRKTLPPSASPPPTKPDPNAPTISAPMPRIPDSSIPGKRLSGSLTKQDSPAALSTQTELAEKHERDLASDAKNLEEILHNQSHPNNLAAIRKTGTPVLDGARVDAKTLFAATAGDEFEILDVNPEWVHVRISGLSRGWIRRSNLEMPGDANAVSNTGNGEDGAAPFRVSSQQFAPFPGDWEPLRGKTVKVVTIQKSSENAPNPGPQAKKDFAQALFTKQYAEVVSSSQGIVLIFDAEDGGMVAATLSALQQWRAGTLSDDAFWHQCFFDPPEFFSQPPTPASLR